MTQETFITTYNSATNEFLLISVYCINGKAIKRTKRRSVFGYIKKVSVQSFESVKSLDDTILSLEERGHNVITSPIAIDGIFDLDLSLWTDCVVHSQLTRILSA